MTSSQALALAETTDGVIPAPKPLHVLPRQRAKQADLLTLSTSSIKSTPTKPVNFMDFMALDLVPGFTGSGVISGSSFGFVQPLMGSEPVDFSMLSLPDCVIGSGVVSGSSLDFVPALIGSEPGAFGMLSPPDQFMTTVRSHAFITGSATQDWLIQTSPAGVVSQMPFGACPSADVIALFNRMPVSTFRLLQVSGILCLRDAPAADAGLGHTLNEDAFAAYLTTLEAPPGPLSKEHMRAIRALWQHLRQVNPSLPLPVAYPMSDGGLQLSWTRSNLHLSVDIYPNDWDWFFRDRETGECDGGERDPKGHLPDAFIARLVTLTQNSKPSA